MFLDKRTTIKTIIFLCVSSHVRKCKKGRKIIIKKDAICNSIKTFQIPSCKSNKKHTRSLPQNYTMLLRKFNKT